MTPEVLILTLYLRLAACVGVTHPLPLPAIMLRDVASVACGGASVDHRCHGVYRAHPRRIVVTYGMPGTLAHELVHDLLRQAGRNDPWHVEAEWTSCHGVMTGE